MDHEGHADERMEGLRERRWQPASMWIEQLPERKTDLFPAPHLPVGVRLPILVASLPWEHDCCWMWVLLQGSMHWMMLFREYQVNRLTPLVFDFEVTSAPQPMRGVVLLGPQGGEGHG